MIEFVNEMLILRRSNGAGGPPTTPNPAKPGVRGRATIVAGGRATSGKVTRRDG